MHAVHQWAIFYSFWRHHVGKLHAVRCRSLFDRLGFQHLPPLQCRAVFYTSECNGLRYLRLVLCRIICVGVWNAIVERMQSLWRRPVLNCGRCHEHIDMHVLRFGELLFSIGTEQQMQFTLRAWAVLYIAWG